MRRVFSLFILLCALLTSNAQNTSSDTVGNRRKPVTVTLRVPEPGIYAVSVIDKDVVSPDTVQRTIVDWMLNDRKYLQNIHDTATLQFGFETEHTISGRVIGTFRKVKNPQIIVFNPVTTERQDYSLDHHQSFNLNGFDIQEGGSLTIQATRESGSVGFLQLKIKEPYFPKLSMAHFLKGEDSMQIPHANEDKLMMSVKASNEKYNKEVTLDEVVTTGNKLKPLNDFGLKPTIGYTYLDDMLAKANSIKMLISRMGFTIQTIGFNTIPGRYRPSTGGIKFVVPAVYIDKCKIEEDEMDELWSLDPQDIKQIEYFTEDQTEARLTLHATGSGAICIYTKNSRPRRNQPSVVNIHPLGYRVAKVPYNPLKDSAYTSIYDQRVTLLWNPSLAIDESCKTTVTFLPSAHSRHYAISIEGIGNSGQLVCTRGAHDNAQTLSEDEEQEVSDYLYHTPREKVYVQTDRSQYCAGDTVWMRIHIADALANIPTTSKDYPQNRSMFAYVELHKNGNLNKKGKETGDSLIERIMIKRDSLGVFQSYIALPKNLATSNYTIVSYTRHELNFSEEQFFYKQIHVVGLKE